MLLFKNPNEDFCCSRNLLKDSISPIVKNFVCQALEKHFDYEYFIDEQNLESFDEFFGEDFEEYSSDKYEDSNDESDFEDYDVDLLSVKINNTPVLMITPHVLPTQLLPVVPTLPIKSNGKNYFKEYYKYNERLLVNIPIFMLCPHITFTHVFPTN